MLRNDTAGHGQFTPMHAAVGESEGTMDFNVAEHDHSNSLLPRHPDHPEREQPAQTRVRRIDEFCKEQRLDRVDILKLDVEGYEGPALRGCGDLLDGQRIGLIFADIRFQAESAGGTTSPDLCAMLFPRRYQFFGFYDPMFTPDPQFAWNDVIFASEKRLAEYRLA